MRWNPDGTYELEPVEQIARDAFEEMADWGHSDALAWAWTRVFQEMPDTAVDVGFWEWLIWGRIGPVVEASAYRAEDGSVVWIADLAKDD